jgi:thymidylate synthase (FAD)
MAHKIVPDADLLLGKEIPVLDKGFVKLVDYMGDDARICEAARVSYGEGTKTVKDNEALIDFLLRNEHTSPFEKVILEYHIKLPIFVARQFIRHRTARVSEISGRYSVMKNDFYYPKKEDLRQQSKANRQCSGDRLDDLDAARVLNNIHMSTELAYTMYEENLKKGASREISRIGLPLNLYTEWYWQMDLHNLMHFLKLRLAKDAQYEIQQYAKAMFDLATLVCPIALEAFNNLTLEGVRLSGAQKTALKSLLDGSLHWPDILKLSKIELDDLKNKFNLD